MDHSQAVNMVLPNGMPALSGHGEGDAAPAPDVLVDYREALRDRRAGRRLMATTLRWLSALMPTRAAVFHTIDGSRRITGPVVFKLDKAEPAWLPGEYLRCLSAGYRERSPFSLAAHEPSGVNVVDAEELGGPEAFASTRYAKQFLAPLGVATQTTLYLHRNVRVAGAIALLRAHDQGALTRAQRSLLEWSHGLIQEAFALATHHTSIEDRAGLLDRHGLTSREIEVALMAASGDSNREIAHTLTLSPATVKSHLNRSFAKLNVRSRTQLAVLLTGEAV